MRKWLRICILVLGSLLGLLILLWLAIAFYIRQNKTSLLQQINTRLSERLNGGILIIKDMEPSLVKSFPDISVSLQEVKVRDSLWEQHRHSLVEVDRIFVQVNTFSLLRKQLDIKRITLDKGSIYLFTDSTGYANSSVLKSRKRTVTTDKGREPDITALVLDNIRFVLDNRQKGKLFDFAISSMTGNMKNNDSGWTAAVNLDLKVSSLAFNTDKGSFLKDKRVETSLDLQYNRIRKVLDIPQQTLRIDGQPISAGASFSFGEQPRLFTVHIVADKIPYSHATSLLTPHVQGKLEKIQLKEPLDAEVQLNGVMGYKNIPLVHVTWKTTDNTVNTQGMELNKCSFGGSFINEWRKGEARTDENSVVSIYALKTHCYGIPVSADTIRISNMKHPALTGYFKSKFQLTELNNGGGAGVFNFTSGTADAFLYYKGGIKTGDTVTPYLEGTVQLKDGALEYLPRSLAFTGCNATLDFTGQDLYLKDISIKSAKSSLQMEGSVRNIASLYFTAPEKLQLDWKVNSPMIDLDEFRSFLGKRKSGVKPTKAAARKKINRVANQLDVMLNSCNVNMQLKVDKLTYSHFSAQQVVADLGLTQTDILLRRISLSHAGGSIQLNGNVKQDGNNNRFKINAGISNVHIDQLFHAFNNFGMQSLGSKNLKGILSAKADITGNVRDNGTMAPQSMYGTLSFDLRQGALVHFAPLEEIGDLAFRKRNLGNITFDNLKNTLTLKGNKIIIPPMQINSSALYMDVTGIYGIPTGTDVYITVPLRNPKKDEEVTDKQERRKRSRKGIVLHLHATDDENGKVKIKMGGRKEKGSANAPAGEGGN